MACNRLKTISCTGNATKCREQRFLPFRGTKPPACITVQDKKCQNVVRTELNSRIGPYALPLAGGGAKHRRWLCGDIPPASLQPSQQGLYATNPRCMTSARVCTGSPSRSASRFPDRRRGKTLRLSSQDHHLASPEARSASKPPLRSSRMSSMFSVPMDRRMVPGGCPDPPAPPASPGSVWWRPGG